MTHNKQIVFSVSEVSVSVFQTSAVRGFYLFLCIIAVRLLLMMSPTAAALIGCIHPNAQMYFNMMFCSVLNTEHHKSIWRCKCIYSNCCLHRVTDFMQKIKIAILWSSDCSDLIICCTEIVF